jgi:hypothetical protein
MKRKALIVPVLVLVLCLAAVSESFAAIYKYVDKQGMISFADNLQSIPQEYRASAVLMGDGQEAVQKTAPTNTAPEQRTAAPMRVVPAPPLQEKPWSDGIKKSFFNNRVLISIGVVVSALFAFIILGILNADHKKSIRIVRVVILWGASLYLLVAHAGDVVGLFKSVDSSIDSAKRESEEKGKKAARALKEMNSLMQQVDQAASQEPGKAEPEKKE